jgi:hypothetical protein
MPSSGTSTFNLDLRDIVEDAFEKCGLEVRSGMDYRSARRSMDLLFIKWAQKGVNFWTLEEATTALTAGTETVTLDADVLDVLEIYTRTNAGTVNQNDLHVKPIGVKEWAQLPTKKTRGRPVNVWVEKLRDAPVLHLWPVPDQAYTLVYHQLVRIQDTGTPGTNTADVPWRFLPPLVSGLALEIARKRAPERIPIIEAEYREDWTDATSADRERRPTRFSPNLNAYRR